MSDVDCPYCGAEQEICQDDGHGCEEGTVYEQECDECEKTFVFTASIHYHFDASQADCLNGANHDWKIIKDSWIGDRRRCRGCDRVEYDWAGKGEG